MRATTALLVALSAAAAQCHDFARRQVDNATASPSDATPRRYIIELKSREQGAKAASRAAELPGLRVVKHFDSDIFPGVSVECEGACDAESLTAAFNDGDDDDGDETGSLAVAQVYKAQRIKLAPVVEEETPSADALAASQNNTIHKWTGVQKLHEAGVLGSGAVVAVVDSGIQYTHPALGGGIGPNFTVIGGYDLVGKNWPDEPPTPDDDPTDEYGHGTHVAGIIAGNSDQITGVAPSAKLLAFKVFGDSGYSDEEIVIEGFLKAYDSGADIISSSLGENNGFSNDAWAVVASRMVDRGVIVVIAAGNAGQDGPWLASNGAAGRHVLTVGSVDPHAFPAQTFSLAYDGGGGNSTDATYVPGNSAFPKTVVDRPVVPLTTNTSVENDACEPLPSDTPSFEESIVLIKFGGCTVDTKHANVAAFGAQYVLFYSSDNTTTESAATLNATGLTGSIDASTAKSIIDAVLNESNVTASFDTQTSHYVSASHSAAGGKPALYTSWGGTFDLSLKPDISAPGSKILSTYPTDAYQVLSGTSMATPYIAGVAALYVGQHGGRAAHADDPAWAGRAIARIMSSGRSVPWSDWVATEKDFGFWAPPPQVGAGLVDAAAVVGFTTQLGFEGRKFELNDTANFVGTHALDITNGGDEAVTYTFSLQDAGGFDSWDPKVPGQSSYGVPSIVLYAWLVPVVMTPEVAFPDEITVGPGETASVEFTFTAPSGLNASSIPVYSGKILIGGSNGETLGVPYFGVGCDVHGELQEVFDYGAEYPTLQVKDSVPIGDNPEPITFNFTQTSQDFPHLNSRLAWGTEELRWDIFDANWTEADWAYPPVIGEKGYVGSATSWNGTDTSGYFDPEKHSADDIFSFPLNYKVRSVWERFWWLGRFANGTEVQDGVYNFRIAALRPFGNKEISEDWDVFELPQITIERV